MVDRPMVPEGARSRHVLLERARGASPGEDSTLLDHIRIIIVPTAGMWRFLQLKGAIRLTVFFHYIIQMESLKRLIG